MHISSGVGAMELVAMEMKQRGMYLARQLSFQGVQFNIERVPLSQDYLAAYNSAVDFVHPLPGLPSASPSAICGGIWQGFHLQIPSTCKITSLHYSL